MKRLVLLNKRSTIFLNSLILFLCLTSQFLLAQNKAEFVTIDVDNIRSWIQNAPMERTVEASNKIIAVSLPLPQGLNMEVKVIESPIIDEALSARYPDVKTFAFQGITNPAYSGRLMVSPRGIDYFMFTPEGDYMLTPDEFGSTIHKLEKVEPGKFPHLSNDAVKRNGDGSLEHKHSPDGDLHKHSDHIDNPFPDPVTMMTYAIGPQLRNFNMHVIADAEYSIAVCGVSPTRGCVEMAIMTALNGMNALYIRDMAVKLIMINTTTIYLATAANPSIFAAGGGGSNPPWLDESAVHHLQMESASTSDGSGGVNPIVARNSYDVGHLFSARVGSGLGGGGVAQLESVCNDNTFTYNVVGGAMSGIAKAAGGSAVPSPQGTEWVELLAHEFTHQFNADHTWSGNSGNCTPGQWSGPPAGRTSYEPGGGSTIVSYTTICADDNIPNPGNTLYYHTASIKEVNDYIASAGVTCETNTASGNQPPVPSVNTTGCTPNYNIPVRTPFEITGSATDDGAATNLTYTWEQFDLASAQHDPISAPTMVNTNNTPNTLFPLFRSYFPSSSPTRTFPSASIIASGNYNGDAQNATALTQANWQGELLPEVAGRITLRLTVRDNHTTSGGVEHADALIDVVNTAGPFSVTAPSTSNTIFAGNATTVTWNVANTDQAPINCSAVNIKLSIDGGLTFPYTLASATANDGSESVTIPQNIPNTSTARIRVECGTDCFKFFDINNINFTISSNCFATSNNICPTDAMNLNQGDAGLNLSLANHFGSTVSSYTFNITVASLTGPVANATTSGGTTCQVLWPNSEKYETFDFVPTATGTYTFMKDAPFVVFSIFEATGYNPAMPCAGTFLGSNSTGAISASSSATATLSACTKYKLVVWTVNGANVTSVINISGIRFRF